MEVLYIVYISIEGDTYVWFSLGQYKRTKMKIF